jgi:retinol dehydrogenase 12
LKALLELTVLTLVIPWGRFYPISQDLVQATKPEDEGGAGTSLKFWEWSEEQVKKFV